MRCGTGTQLGGMQRSWRITRIMLQSDGPASALRFTFVPAQAAAASCQDPSDSRRGVRCLERLDDKEWPPRRRSRVSTASHASSALIDSMSPSLVVRPQPERVKSLSDSCRLNFWRWCSGWDLARRDGDSHDSITSFASVEQSIPHTHTCDGRRPPAESRASCDQWRTQSENGARDISTSHQVRAGVAPHTPGRSQCHE